MFGKGTMAVGAIALVMAYAGGAFDSDGEAADQQAGWGPHCSKLQKQLLSENAASLPIYQATVEIAEASYGDGTPYAAQATGGSAAVAIGPMTTEDAISQSRAMNNALGNVNAKLREKGCDPDAPGSPASIAKAQLANPPAKISSEITREDIRAMSGGEPRSKDKTAKTREFGDPDAHYGEASARFGQPTMNIPR